MNSSDIVKVRRKILRIPKDARLGDVENKFEWNDPIGEKFRMTDV
jgi:hypothetical protein